jgi:hypothetical protein
MISMHLLTEKCQLAFSEYSYLCEIQHGAGTEQILTLMSSNYHAVIYAVTISIGLTCGFRTPRISGGEIASQFADYTRFWAELVFACLK